MNYEDPKFKRHLAKELGENYKFSPHFGSAFSRISGKIDVLDSIIFLNVIMDQSTDGGTLEHQVNELFMMAKLHYADEIRERRAVILKAVATRIERELLEEKREKLKQLEWQQIMDAVKNKQLAFNAKNSTSEVTQPNGIGDNPAENIKNFGTYISFRDALLTLIDKIRSGTCTVLDKNELDLMQVLEDVHKLKLVSKGWLVKTFQFEDDNLAQSVRALIVVGK